MNHRTVAAVICFGIMPFAAPALAWDLTIEERTVSTSAGAGLDFVSDSDAAPDQDPWMGEARSAFSDDFTGEFGIASATQASAIQRDNLNTVSFQGSLSANGSTDGFASARSRLITQFDLAAAGRFEISGSVTSLLGSSGSSASIRLINENSVVRYELSNAELGLYTDGTEPIRFISVLGPGTWTLDFGFNVSGFEGATDQIDYDLTFFLPTSSTASLVLLGVLATGRRKR